MANPFCFELKSVTNDVIKSKEIKPTITGSYNSYRIDEVEVIVAAHAGIATGDYLIMELDYEDLNGNALADLKEIDDKEYIERCVIGPWLIEATAKHGIIENPAIKPLIFKFKNAFVVNSENFFINFLINGLAAPRDCQFIMRGNPVQLKPMALEAHTKKTTI